MVSMSQTLVLDEASVRLRRHCWHSKRFCQRRILCRYAYLTFAVVVVCLPRQPRPSFVVTSHSPSRQESTRLTTLPHLSPFLISLHRLFRLPESVYCRWSWVYGAGHDRCGSKPQMAFDTRKHFIHTPTFLRQIQKAQFSRRLEPNVGMHGKRRH
jgi:hypothetical protein